MRLRITDSSGHILYSKEDAMKGKFAFTTEDYDMFEVCFESKSQMALGRVPDQLINLNMKHGVEAKNYEEIAKVEKLKPLEVELRRLEDLSESIVNDFAYMKKREEEMRDTNESTNTRVLYFSVFSMCCLIGLATWQVFYLRRFFKAKKLIEMPGADKETDLSERIEAFLAEMKRSGSGSGSVRGSAETARDTAALLRRITAQARWSSAGVFITLTAHSRCTLIAQEDVD
ncbi:hypothetical protein QTP86_007637 [Hemibagrus guttatus]|nr:hypothetical protein QTP86_007637 [Hemibagrus guttatus]